METPSFLNSCNLFLILLRKELLSERDGNNLAPGSPNPQGLPPLGRNYSLKEMETENIFLINPFEPCVLRKELLSERDGNTSALTTDGFYKFFLRKELLSERDGNSTDTLKRVSDSL